MDDLAFMRREELLGAPMATLTRRAETPEAKSLVEAVLAVLEDHETHQSTRQRKRTKDAQRGFERAIEAFLGDLHLGARKAKGGWVYRSLHTKSFSGQEVGYRPFTAMVDSMEGLGLIEIVPGFNATKTIQWEGGPTSRYQLGKAARFRATQARLDLASRTGVEVNQYGKHFQEPTPRALVALKDSSVRIGRDKVPGRPMEFVRTPTVERIEEQVQFINEFWKGIKLSGGSHQGFYRGFNLGDHPSFNWNKGGRLYSNGEDSYQRLKQRDRFRMTFDGEPVAQIDIRASYLTILHGKLGVPLEASGDLYAVPSFPRDVVKAWLVATLGSRGHLKRWPPKQAQAFMENTGQNLSQTYPIKAVRAAMIAKYLVLAQWGQVDIDWADLMFAESEAVIGSMVHLITVFQVPALPVHDSLLVPVSKIDHCIHSLTPSYMVHCKIRPQLKVNEPEWDWAVSI
jgi:hypothetical protein